MNIFTYPDEWGILCTRDIPAKVRKKDLEVLRMLQDKFMDEFYGQPVPFKSHLMPLAGGRHRRDWLKESLNRLWRGGYIEKFARSLHTQSGRPNYVSYFLWLETPIEVNENVPRFSY